MAKHELDTNLTAIDVRAIRTALKILIEPSYAAVANQPFAGEQAAKTLEKLAGMYCSTTDEPL